MCTIILLHRVVENLPVVVAANRDELYERGATSPRVWSATNAAGAAVVAGRDQVKGGTWMGVTSDGFFAAVTNQKSWTPPQRDLESRGSLVARALELGRRNDVRAMLSAIDPCAYNPFNLVFGDADGLEVAYGRREATSIQIEEVPPGLHVLPNDCLDSDEFAKVSLVERELADARLTRFTDAEPALRALLGDHRIPPLDEVEPPPKGARFDRAFAQRLQALCIHTDFYGTRSATLAALAAGRTHRYLFADGPPCQTPFVDLTNLLEKTR